MDTTKKPYLSKTLWVNLVLALLAIVFPAGNAFLSAHPETVVAAFTVINMILRVVTKSPLSFLE